MGIGEVIARITYVKPWYLKLIEEQKANYLRIKPRINALGLRGGDYQATKAPNCMRVLVLGDSFTFGSGVGDDAAIFPEVLENKLSMEFLRQGEKIEILNGGIPGSLTSDWVDLLLKLKDPFKPDIILVVFFMRDGTKTSSMGSFFSPIREEMKLRDKQSFLYQHLFFFRFIQEYRDRVWLSKKYSTALLESYFGDTTQTEEWQNAQRNILKIKKLGDEMNAKVALVVFPILVELNRNYPFKDIDRAVSEFGIRHHIPVHSLLPAFMGKNGAQLWVSHYDQHPNAQAHLIAADSILPFLRELLVSTGAGN